MNSMRTNLKKTQQGLSLVEILVSLVLAMILMAGVGQVYLSTKQAYNTSEAVSRVQENGRFAITKIAEDMRMAGFMGCGAGGLNVTNNLDSSHASYDPDLYDFSVGIEGEDGASATDPDTIRVKYATDFGVKVVQLMVQRSGVIKVSATDQVVAGDIVLVCDAAQGDIFQATSMTGGGGTKKDTAGHNTGSSYAPGNANQPGACSGSGSNPHCLSKAYDTNARLFGVEAFEYSIGTGSGSGSPPALFRAQNGVAVEIAEGVENMQVVYGEDTTGDARADVYRNATNVADWDNVISVRVSLLVRTGETNLTQTVQTYNYDHDGDGVETQQTAGDNRIRRVYTTTVALRNRAL